MSRCWPKLPETCSRRLCILMTRHIWIDGCERSAHLLFRKFPTGLHQNDDVVQKMRPYFACVVRRCRKYGKL